jgi:hypothetical protein
MSLEFGTLFGEHLFNEAVEGVILRSPRNMCGVRSCVREMVDQTG